MDRLEEKVKEVKEVYCNIAKKLDNLTDDNFNQVMGQVNNDLRLVNNLVKYVKNQYNDRNLSKYNIEIEPLIKQINIQFDNIIDKIKTEQSEISKELNNFQNKKKLANYNR